MATAASVASVSSAARVELERSEPFFAAVEVEHADAALLAHRFGAIEIAHESKRHAQDVADAERDGSLVDVRKIAVEEVGDDARFPGAENFLGYLAAGGEAAARNRVAAARTRHLELELVGRRRQHDEASLGAADFDRRIEHQRQHVVEDAPGAERAQPFEQRRNLPQVAYGCRRGLVDGGRVVSEQEHHLGAAAASEPDPIAMDERLLGDLLTVDVGSVTRVLVADEERVVLGIDLGVIARDLAAGKSEVVGFAPPDFEVSFRDRNDAAAQRVGHFKAGIGHENRNYCTIRTFRNAAAPGMSKLTGGGRTRAAARRWPRPG